jgi:hypothetical protein
MKNKAILTLLVDQQEIFKVTTDKLFVRSCEFTCNKEETTLLREQGKPNGRFKKFQLRLAVHPLTGPCPQYVEGNGQVTSLRRHSQDCFAVIVSFEPTLQEGYRLIAEHLSQAAEEPASDCDSSERSAVTDINAIKANTA